MIVCEYSKITFDDEQERIEYWRKLAKKSFFPIWKWKIATKQPWRETARKDQYEKLADYLWVDEPDAHISNMSIDNCRKVIQYSFKRKVKYMWT